MLDILPGIGMRGGVSCHHQQRSRSNVVNNNSPPVEAAAAPLPPLPTSRTAEVGRGFYYRVSQVLPVARFSPQRRRNQTTNDTLSTIIAESEDL